MKEPRVKELVEVYQKGNLVEVYNYLKQEDMNVDPSTWSGRVLQLLEDNNFITAKEVIELTAYKFFNLK
jgi:hypothetical protein